MLNLHRLFYREADPISFHAELLPEPAQRAALTQAKNDIRDHLRIVLGAASVAKFGMSRRVEPRFRTQGSWSYDICVQPAHLPPQEMDWDLGVYLPAIVWQGTKPAFAAKTYFTLVEGSLKELCTRKGWTLATGAERKDSCIRIKIAKWAHIDIPLYAAPEAQFVRISEMAKSLAFSERARKTADLLREFAEDADTVEWAWDQLQDIQLALRSGEWKSSDPFRITRWFLDCIDEYGEQLRRVCRYLKGWRDHHWPDGGGPTSVMLMICACEQFELARHRDDIALQRAAERMSAMLLGSIHVQAIDNSAEDFNRLSAADRKEAANRASDLRWAIEQSRGYGASLKTAALQNLQRNLGPRIPNDVTMIAEESAADHVRATPASTVAAPIVTNTRSG